MAEETQQNEKKTRGRRKRVPTTVARVLMLVLGSAYLLVFGAIASTGYLSWIGITIGTIFFAPMVIGPALGLAGSKRWERRLGWLPIAVLVLTAVAAVAVLVWPEGDDTWRPYRFEAELAAIEARRAVPDEENAALRYDALFATLDINNRPDFLFAGSRLRDEFSGSPWRSEDYPEASRWLDSHSDTIRELLLIGKMEECRWPVYATIGCEWTVPYEKLWYGTRLLVAAGHRDLGEGRIESAMKTSFCLLRQAGHLYQQTHGVDYLGGFRRERAGLRVLRRVLFCSELSRENLATIAGRLPGTANNWQRDIARLLEFEEYRFANTLAPVYEINEDGQVRFAAACRVFAEHEELESFRKGRLWRLYWYLNMPLDPQGVWDMARKESARVARLLEPGPVFRSEPVGLGPFGPSFVDASRVIANCARFGAEFMCSDGTMYVDLGNYYAEQLARRRGTWLVLGLRKYKDAHGRWPEALDATAEYVPAEAFDDPTSGEAFVYAREGQSFRLYSQGLNRVDEGGRCGYVEALGRFEDDISLWPPPALKTEAQDEESTKDELMELYGPDYVESLSDGSKSERLVPHANDVQTRRMRERHEGNADDK